jgi:hypothetical protein
VSKQRSSSWIRLAERKPKDRQGCIVTIHTWSHCTDGKGNLFWVDNGVFVVPTCYHAKPFASETGGFIDGFAFSDNDPLFRRGNKEKIKHWQPYNEKPPKDA